MNNLINAIAYFEDMTFVKSLIVFVLAIVFIFTVLAVIMGLLYLLKLLNKDFAKGSAQEDKKEQVMPVNDDDEDEQLVAAVTAAVLSYMESENITAPFKIKSIKRK